VPALRGGPVPVPLHRRAAETGVGIQDPAVDAAPWPFDPEVDARAFELLGFAGASAGIARTQRANREGWWAHAARHKAFILDAAARVEHPRLAVVLGAGKTYDLPVEELARRFERVVLVDIDAASLRERAFATNVEALPMDVTGVASRLARGIEAAFTSASPEADLETLCRSYRLAAPPRLVHEERADLLVSGMVLSQLGLQPKLAAKRLYEARFGPVTRDSGWTAAFDGLELRLQQDHIDALCDQAGLAVITSDVIHHSAGQSWSAIGAERLEARVPPFLEVVARAAWSWDRVKRELRTDVHALLLRRRPE
jgi:hypothetical protein